MTSYFSILTRVRSVLSRLFPLSALCFALCTHDLCAQVGDNNPGGASGIFNGQINTGCSYDPFTGNATRSITDIAVAGAVGEYPLALIRTANSRTPSLSEVFGSAGGWNHNYNWTMDDSPVGYTQNFAPGQYTVNFPDGRVETFKPVTWDNACYRVRASNGGNTSSAGVRDRLAPLNAQQGNFNAYLVLPDGGKVKFHAIQHNYQGLYRYTYTAAAIIDPYGLQTTLTWETVNGRNRLTQVQEPGGRYLQIAYSGNGPRISQVQEFINSVGRRAVQYYYPYGMLDRVVYYNDPNWTANYKYTGSNTGQNLPPLLWTCDDAMYPGPMRRIVYEYKTGNNADGTTAVYGQILRERYWDGVATHEANGVPVSELTIGASNPVNHNIRTEKRANDPNLTRTFTYSAGGYLTWMTDFMGHSANQTYDSYKWINSVTNFRRIATGYTCDPITGNVTQVRFPLTPDDTPGQGNTRPTVNYTYTNNSYLGTIRNEAGNATTITRDANNRVTRVDYPDGGYETFGYDASHFNQVSSHRMIPGGTETFAYDARGRLQYYSDPYHNNTNNPTATYYYDGLDRVSGIADALNQSTNFDYNDRGQVTVTTLPWINGVRYTISNLYNLDATLQTRTDELGHVVSYTYDDYRRLRTVTPPVRGAGDNGVYTTKLYYDANGSGDDYHFTDSKVTWVKLPSAPATKRIHHQYDDNRRTISVTLAPGTVDEAITSYNYDNAGNVTWVINPLNHNNVHTLYDERSRPYSISVANQTTTISYDTAGRRKTIQRPNGQTITSDSFDIMNRVTQQTATQTPDPNAVTKFTYYTTADGPNAPVGFLKTMKDPRLVQLNNGEAYNYEYDLIGRRKRITYPRPQANGLQTYEQWAYDNLGRLETFINRGGKVQSFSYDQLSRMTGFSWNDGGLTPSVTFGYDEVSRLTEIDNANANISRTYYNDNSLHVESQSLSPSGGVDNRHITYTYDEDGNRASLAIPGYTFDYLYTNRNQVRLINDDATAQTQAYYEYDSRGNVTLRNVNTSPVTVSNYNYDAHDQVTLITHTLNRTTRTFSYGYDSNSNNRLWGKRGITPTSTENNKGEAFSYDRADQAIAFQLNVANPQNVSQPLPQNTSYDSNGNRTVFRAVQYGAANNLSQYTTRTVDRTTTSAAYDAKGNLTNGFDTSSYVYDAQNRLLSATNNGVTATFKYDGLNRQVSRTVGGTTTYSTWDRWNLVEEYTNNPFLIGAKYLYGPTGLVKELQNNRFYCQDGSGSTAVLAGGTGHLLEWYRYDLQGTPFFYNANDAQRSASDYSVRHLFTGQQWFQEIGLYDLRNRFYSPDLGRFLQPDPIGFSGGNNLYRYCGNNPVTKWDPFGLQASVPTNLDGTGAAPWHEAVVVTGSDVPEPIDRGGTGAPSGAGGGGPGGEAGGGSPKLTGINFSYGKPPPQSNSRTEQQPPGIMVPFDIYHPATTGEFIVAGNIIEHGDTTATTPEIDPIEILSAGIAGVARGFVRAAVPAAQQRTITVLGSRRAIEAGAYATRPHFNVFRPAANITKQEVDRANAEWLNAAIVRGDDIWLVTHPEQHARFLQSLPPGAFERSNYIHLELPMLEQYKAVELIIDY